MTDFHPQSPDGLDHPAELNSVVDLLQVDAMLHTRAAGSEFEGRVFSASVADLTARRHPPALRLASDAGDHLPARAHRQRHLLSGLRLAAAVAFLGTLAASFLAVRGPAASTTSGVTIANASMPSVIEDWDLLLGGETATAIAAGSESLLKDSETIGKRWSSEYSDADWTMLEEGSM